MSEIFRSSEDGTKGLRLRYWRNADAKDAPIVVLDADVAEFPLFVQIRIPHTQVATIELAASRSEALDGRLYAGMIVHVPPLTANRYIGVAVQSPENAAVYSILRDAFNAPVVIQSLNNTLATPYVFPAEWFPAGWFKLVLMTNASVETPAAARLRIGLTFKS